MGMDPMKNDFESLKSKRNSTSNKSNNSRQKNIPEGSSEIT